MSTITERKIQTKINTNTGKFEIAWTFFEGQKDRVVLRKLGDPKGYTTYRTLFMVDNIGDLHDLRDALSEFFVEVSKQGLMHRK